MQNNMEIVVRETQVSAQLRRTLEDRCRRHLRLSPPQNPKALARRPPNLIPTSTAEQLPNVPKHPAAVAKALRWIVQAGNPKSICHPASWLSRMTGLKERSEYIYTYIYVYIHMCMYMYMYMYWYMYMYIYIYIHTYEI